MIVDDQGNPVELDSATFTLTLSDEMLSGITEMVSSKVFGSVASQVLSDTVKKPYLGAAFGELPSSVELAQTVSSKWIGSMVASMPSAVALADTVKMPKFDYGIGSVMSKALTDALLDVGFGSDALTDPVLGNGTTLDDAWGIPNAQHALPEKTHSIWVAVLRHPQKQKILKFLAWAIPVLMALHPAGTAAVSREVDHLIAETIRLLYERCLSG